MNTIDILKAAKQLLIDKGWTQEAFARGPSGGPLVSRNPLATCYCGIGAIGAAGYGAAPARYDAEDALAKAAGVKEVEDFFDFNDAPGRTVDEVLAVFDKAIAAEETKA